MMKHFGPIAGLLIAIGGAGTVQADPVDPNPAACVPNFSTEALDTPLLDYAPHFVRPNGNQYGDHLFKAYFVNKDNFGGSLEVTAFFMCITKPIERAYKCYEENGLDVEGFLRCMGVEK